MNGCVGLGQNETYDCEDRIIREGDWIKVHYYNSQKHRYTTHYGIAERVVPRSISLKDGLIIMGGDGEVSCKMYNVWRIGTESEAMLAKLEEGL